MWGGPVRVWDVQTGKGRTTLLDEKTRLTDFAYSPNSYWLATEDGAGVLKLWDVNNGQEVATFEVNLIEGISHWRPNFAFSPDGQTLAFVNRNESTATLWDLTQWRKRAVLPGASRPVVFSFDSQTLATAFGPSIRFWDVATGKDKARTQ